MVRMFDDWLFDRVFQPAVNQFPGASPVECGRFFLMGGLFTAFYAIASDLSVPNVALWLVGVGAGSYMYFAVGRLNGSRGRNPMRVAPLCCPTRVFLVSVVLCNALTCAVAGPSANVVGFVFNAAMVLFLYVGACDTPPPGREARSAKPGRLAYAGLTAP